MLLKAKSTIPIFGLCRIYDITAVFTYFPQLLFTIKGVIKSRLFSEYIRQNTENRKQNTEIYRRLPRHCAPRNDNKKICVFSTPTVCRCVS